MTINAFKKSAQQKIVLYLVNNSSQYRLAVRSCINSNFNFLIFFKKSNIKYVLNDEIDLPGNVKVTTDYKTVAMLVGNIKLIITMVGHFSPVLNSDFVSIVKFSHEIGIPILEVPHGLFQLGYNFEDDSILVSGASNHDGLGYTVPSFASKQITWFGDDGIGYPFHDKKDEVSVFPEYTVITTNTNWYMYDEFSQIRLATLLIDYAKSNPNDLFVWCPHPAEESAKTLFYLGMSAAPKNILTYGINKDVYFSNFKNTEDVIANAVKGITTVSTCILDYEINKVPLIVFTASSFDSLLSDSLLFSRCDLNDDFCSIDFSIPVTGLYKKFDVKKFDIEIGALANEPRFNKMSSISKYL